MRRQNNQSWSRVHERTNSLITVRYEWCKFLMIHIQRIGTYYLIYFIYNFLDIIGNRKQDGLRSARGEHSKSPILKSRIPHVLIPPHFLQYPPFWIYLIFRTFSPDLNYTPIFSKCPYLYYPPFLNNFPQNYYIQFLIQFFLILINIPHHTENGGKSL